MTSFSTLYLDLKHNREGWLNYGAGEGNWYCVVCVGERLVMVVMVVVITEDRWYGVQEQAGHIDAELAIVLSSISLACKQIASLLQRSSIINLTGAQGTMNIQGEDQKKLDVISNELFCNCLRSSGRTGIIASEEEDVPVAVEETSSGNYIVVFDPIDGSANIDIALTTGSIFGIYAPDEQCLVDYDNDTLDEAKEKCVVSVCQPGSNLLAAGYCLYSSSVVFTISIGNGVHGFTLDPAYGEFVLTHEDIKIPKSGRIYSFNEGNFDLWDTKLQNYLNHLRNPGGPAGKPYSRRYIGCLVSEIHRMLLYGGIYGNPQNESKKWEFEVARRLGHLNFKTMNKLVKENLVRGLLSKLFENDQTCVAFQMGKQHRASYKSKTENSISLPLHLLHMELFGPTFVKSLKKKMYFLVVTDDYNRFTWVFFLATKNETSGILKSFISRIENLVDHKLKKQLVLLAMCKIEYHLGKFDGKTDEGLFVGYFLNSKAFRVFNSRTRIVEEKLHIRFSESTPNFVGSGPDWLSDINALTRTINYEPVIAGTQSNGFADQEKEDIVNSTNNVNTDGNVNTVSSTINVVGTNKVNVVGGKISIKLPFDPKMLALEDNSIFDFSSDDEDDDPDFPDRVYKVEKPLYGLHQAPRAWYETLSAYLLDNGFQRGKFDKTLFIKRHKGDILLVQVYVDDIIIGSTKKELCIAFERLMHEKIQMSSMGELTFFLGLQMKQKKDGIFISQDKYVVEILKKFRSTEVKNRSNSMETQKPLLKDEDGEEVDVYMYRSMIGSLMYLTSSRPDIMFAVCACVRYQVNPNVSHLHAVKRIFKYLKGQPKLGLWYPKDSSFDLVAYTDSDNARANLNKKSTIGKLNMWLLQVVVDKCFGFRINYLIMGKSKKHVRLMMEKLFGMKLKFMLCLSPKTIAWNEFSGTMASAIVCLATNQKFNFSKFIFDSMIRNLDNLSGSVIPTDPHHTPIIIPPSTQPQKKQPRKPKRKDTQVPPSDPIENVPNEAVHKELGDSLVRVATTASSLEAEHDSETIRGTTAQTRFKSVSKHFNDSLLARGNTLQSDEDSLKLDEMMALCTTLQNKVLDLEKTTTTQQSSGNEESLGEDASKQGRIDAIDADEEITMVCVQDEVVSNDADKEMFDVNVLDGDELIIDAAQDSVAGNIVSTASAATTVSAATTTTATITTVDDITFAQALEGIKSTKPKEKGIVIQELGESTTTKSSQQSQDKGKGILIEPVKPMKRKDQLRLDDEAALKLQAAFDEKERLAREKTKKMFDRAFKRVYTFDDFRTELVKGKEKRVGTDPIQEITKKQKVEHDKETSELKQFMEIISDEEEVAIDVIPLSVKSPKIVDWKIYKEERKRYYQIIRADEKSQMYTIFSQMLKSFDRKDLEDLYKLVKAKYELTRPVENLDLYCYEIYMLVEKKYPLTPPTLSMMLEKKLIFEYESEMAYQLFRFIMK
nr:fructose-1,6-bisphosphatase, chloroplastic-like [Tanacetum cinerariifolium]